MKRYFVLISIAVGVCVFVGCGKRASDKEGVTGGAPTVTVNVTKIVRGDAEETVTVEGKTEALRKERIVSPIAGDVVQVRTAEGAPVSAGETLAVISPKESQATIEGARALLNAAKTQAEIDEAQRSLRLAMTAQSMVPIRSRYSGVVASRTVNEGELVSEGEELFMVLDLGSLYFAADIPLASLAKVRQGEVCRIAFPSLPGVEFAGRVSAVEPSADPQSQSVKARVAFTPLPAQRRSLVKTDMFGTARIVTGMHKGALLVPPSAVLRDDENNTVSVVVLTPDSLSRTVPVKVGALADSLVEVESPELHEGEAVIIEGNYGLADSTRVRATMTERP